MKTNDTRTSDPDSGNQERMAAGDELKPQPVVGPGLMPREEPGDKEPFSQVETELRARAEEWLRDHDLGFSREAVEEIQSYLLGLLKREEPQIEEWCLNCKVRRAECECERPDYVDGVVKREEPVADDSWMADDCLAIIRETLEKHIDMGGCPPMFYPEAIHNCIAMPKRAIMRATGAEEKVVGEADEDKLVELIVTRMKEAEHFGAMGADTSPRENAEPVGVLHPDGEACLQEGKIVDVYPMHLAGLSDVSVYTSPPQAGRDSEATRMFRDGLQQMIGAFDTPIVRRKLSGGFYDESRKVARVYLKRGDAILATEGDESE